MALSGGATSPITYHSKVECYNGLLKTTLRATGEGTFKNWDAHLAQATWLVNTKASGPAHFKLSSAAEGDRPPVVPMKSVLGKKVWGSPESGKGKPIHGIAFAQGLLCTAR